MQKLKNKIISSKTFQEISNLNKAMSLCFYELIGDANQINSDLSKYESISSERIREVARMLFSENNCNVLYYKSSQHA